MNWPQRFSAYLFVLRGWPGETITSGQMSDVLGMNATQIRRDMLLFESGTRGVGYNRDALTQEILTALNETGHRVRAVPLVLRSFLEDGARFDELDPLLVQRLREIASAADEMDFQLEKGPL